jgi:hypothetical protein
MPRYRELNIMNRVLTKGIRPEPFCNPAPRAFSGVFRPASRMQCDLMNGEQALWPGLLSEKILPAGILHLLRTENLMGSGNAC